MSAISSHAQSMDKVYALQRYIYDVTRRYFLFGRDTLLSLLPIEPDTRILEVGVGTGRNLCMLGKAHPQAQLYGIDASNKMLETANTKLAHAGLSQCTQLRFGLAEQLGSLGSSDFDAPFDVIFFSYTLSMVTDWQKALTQAMRLLKRGGVLGIVDFFDQNTLPQWWRKGFYWYLSKFHVQPRPEMLPFLQNNSTLRTYLQIIGPRYSFIALVTRTGDTL